MGTVLAEVTVTSLLQTSLGWLLRLPSCGQLIPIVQGHLLTSTDYRINHTAEYLHEYLGGCLIEQQGIVTQALNLVPKLSTRNFPSF